MAKLPLTLFTILLSLAATWPAVAQRDGDGALAEKIREMVASAEIGRDPDVGVYLVNADTGVPFVELNSERPFKPASVMKLLTTAAALHLLGPDKTFETRVEIHEPIRDGVVKDLFIVGGGDPTLGPRFQQEDPSDIRYLLKQWAEQLKDAGIRRISNHIFGDARRYSGEPVALGWNPREFAEWYSAEVSALTFNDNCIDFIWRTGGDPGDRAKYRLNPETSYVTVASSVRTGPPNMDTANLRYFRFGDSNEIRARGRIPPRTEKYDYAAIHDPARYTAHLLMETLRSEGIKVDGSAFNREMLDRDDPTTETITLIREVSPPLSQILPIINGDSQNLYAEMLAREIAIAEGAEPSFQGASEAIRDWLRREGIHRNGLVMVDASGLSTLDRASPRQAVEVLKYMAQGKYETIFRKSLAIPGTGTMRNRFRGAKYSALQNTVQAKTGYIDESHTLAGYLTNHRGTRYAFAIMINEFDDRKNSEVRTLIEDITLMLYETPVLP